MWGGDGGINPEHETLLTETNYNNKAETDEQGEGSNYTRKEADQYPYL